ncbi:MAG: hypothetical protein LBS80_04290 [Tannerella sp.]|jgi:Na+/melibiose symporter-like transporter|nr:hypothetical protein [Tannerella sp.]
MKKINIMTIALLAYLLVMAVMFWPGRNPGRTYREYFVVIGVTLVVIMLLRYLRIRLLKIKKGRENDK